MTDRHWHLTPDVPGGLSWESTPDDPGGSDIEEVFCGLGGGDEDVRKAKAALAQCVDTLAKAQALAVRAQSIRRGYGPVEGYRADVAALLDLLSGVPVGGGEPQPTTSTDNDPLPIDLVRELRDAVGLFSGAMPITPRQAWGEAIAVAKRAVRERDAFEAALVALDPTAAQRPVRSAGGGDQPDTPCPHCHNGMVPAGQGLGPDGFDPCPACTDKETPHGP